MQKGETTAAESPLQNKLCNTQDPGVASTHLEHLMNNQINQPSRFRRLTSSARSLVKGHKVGASLAVGSLFLLSAAAIVNSTVDAAPKPTVNIDQCQNSSSVCDTASAGKWTNGNLGQNNSNYPEGTSVPFRAVMKNLVVDATYSLTLEWDTTVNGGKHGYDYLTTYNRTVAAADPCAGVTCSGPTNTLAIPTDPNVSGAGVTQIAGQVFTLNGGLFPANAASIANTGNLCATDPCNIATNPSAYTLSDPYTQNSATRIKLYFTAKATSAVLAWGGHVATQADWGAGMSAVDISGSPYHMMLLSFLCSNNSNCGTGRQDLSMSSSAVAPVVTTTTIPETTTTVPETTTTEPETTTTVGETTTTLGETTTTLAGTTTTITSDTSPAEFPTTGSNSDQLWWMATALIMLGGIAVLSLSFRNRKWH